MVIKIIIENIQIMYKFTNWKILICLRLFNLIKNFNFKYDIFTLKENDII